MSAVDIVEPSTSRRRLARHGMALPFALVKQSQVHSAALCPDSPRLKVLPVERLPEPKYGRVTYCLFFLFASLPIIMGIQARLGVELADDGAFFLRYAENMQSGHFWVWNIGEKPIWGASAPLYPLVLAFVIKLGVPLLAAPVVAGMAMSTVALSILATALFRYVGIAAGLVFISLAALDSGMMYQSAAGLETPLTFLLLSLGVLVILRPSPGWLIGVIAGLLIVHKVDLLPFAAFLVLAHWVRCRKFPLGTMFVSAVIGLAWYGFAELYFGSIVPNSFITKALHQNDQVRNIDWTWFGRRVFAGGPSTAEHRSFLGTHAWSSLLALLGVLIAWRKYLPLCIYLIGGVLVHSIVYTVKPPFEPYDWYTMPSTLSLYVMAAVGFSSVLMLATERLKRRSHGIITEIGSAILMLAMIWVSNSQYEREETATYKFIASHQSFDLAEAGRWVDKNVPHDFRVLTWWGNPAYHSHRQVIDASFLNRDFNAGLPTGKDSAEVIILVRDGPDANPSKPVASSGYRDWVRNSTGQDTASKYTPVKVFRNTFSAGYSWFAVVLIRNDLLGEIKNIDVTLDVRPAQ